MDQRNSTFGFYSMMWHSEFIFRSRSASINHDINYNNYILLNSAACFWTRVHWPLSFCGANSSTSFLSIHVYIIIGDHTKLVTKTLTTCRRKCQLGNQISDTGIVTSSSSWSSNWPIIFCNNYKHVPFILKT